MVYIVMGVSGAGKTTIGRILAKKLAIDFHDADDFHPPINISKMMNRVPLGDEDRTPWLADLATHISAWNEKGGVVLACSALKEKYRDILTHKGKEKVIFIYLQGDKTIIQGRMEKRKNHYFSVDLLGSQFKALETPSDGITVQIDRTPEEICTVIIDKLIGQGVLRQGHQRNTTGL